jgi:sulfatase modifying factor 1
MPSPLKHAISKAPPNRPKSRPSGWLVLTAYAGLAALVAVVLAGVYFASSFFANGLDDIGERRPPKLNKSAPPGPAPNGMVWVPGGEFYMGVDESIVPPDDGSFVDYYSDARYVHLVYVDGFWMDQHETTVEQFAEFFKATGYITIAERKPKIEDFPGADPDKLAPFSLVFKKPEAHVVDVHRAHRLHDWWDARYGASWKSPEGPGSDVKSMSKFPVVHICWDDAVAYCKWAGRRLPTEAEWEFAARGGLDRNQFVWGNELKVDGKWMCNAWQGDFPNANTKEDGFDRLAPVGQYPPNGYGIYDMAGNVWEWCSDWYVKEAYLKSQERNPKGPVASFDLNEPGMPKRVQRGGSFLCADNYCRRYIPGARGKGEVTSAAGHIGFRCVMDAAK